MQLYSSGDPWGSIQCSAQMDGIGRESLKPELEPFIYKGEIEIPALGMVDDLLKLSESGYKTIRQNSFINTKIAIKSYNGPK